MPCLSAHWLPYGPMDKVVGSYATGKFNLSIWIHSFTPRNLILGLVAVWDVWKSNSLLKDGIELKPRLSIQAETTPIRSGYWLDEERCNHQ